MTLKAVFFGSIGSFSESSKLQLDSFNQSMRINQIDEIWNEEEYIGYLKISGGINRLKSILPKNIDESIIKKIHLDKTKLFQKKILESGSLIRPGFERLCKELLESNIILGIASTTSKKTIENILSGLKSIKISDFEFITHSGIVNKQKPDPEVYKICLKELKIKESESIAFEDTFLSLKSAISAGIKSIAIPGNLSLNQDFSQAILKINDYKDINLSNIKDILQKHV